MCDVYPRKAKTGLYLPVYVCHSETYEALYIFICSFIGFISLSWLKGQWPKIGINFQKMACLLYRIRLDSWRVRL